MVGEHWIGDLIGQIDSYSYRKAQGRVGVGGRRDLAALSRALIGNWGCLFAEERKALFNRKFGEEEGG